jgi:hypothetical protein
VLYGELVRCLCLIARFRMGCFKASEGLGLGMSSSPCNPYGEDYTETLPMVYKWNVPAFQYQGGLWPSESTRKYLASDLPSLMLMLQNSCHDSIDVRPRCSFVTTLPSLRSVANMQVSSFERARCITVPVVLGASFAYRLEL